MTAGNNGADNGRDLASRFKNDVYGGKFGIHPTSKVDFRGLSAREIERYGGLSDNMPGYA